MSPSLPIDLDRSSGQPLYRQIERWIRHAIDGGRLPPGTRLPGVRTLARDLGVSVVPVITAYEQLGADGYLVSQVGLGTMVAPDPPRPIQRVTVPASTSPDARRQPVATGQHHVIPAGRQQLGARATAASRMAGPTPSADVELTRRLARSWSRHLHRARLLTDAAPATARPATTTSASSGCARCWPSGPGCRAPTRPGPTSSSSRPASRPPSPPSPGPGSDRSARSPWPATTRPTPRGALAATGARPLDLDLADEGRRLGPPRERIDLIVVAPAIADGGRARWACRPGVACSTGPRGSGPSSSRTTATARSAPIACPTLASLDGDGRVIGVGSIPAEIAPGAALGYLVVPPALHGPVAAMVLAGGQAPGRVEQEALALMLESGDFDRDLRRLRDALAVTPPQPTAAPGRAPPPVRPAGPAPRSACATAP